MLKKLNENLLPKLAKIGANEQVSDIFNVEETLVLTSSFLYLTATSIWTSMYFVLGQTIPGLITLTYIIFLSITVIIFLWRRNVHFFLGAQLLITLFLPFFLQIAFGGFIPSSGTIIWAIACPLTAFVIDSSLHARRWFVAWVVILIVSGLIDPLLTPTNMLPPTLILMFFIMNIFAVLSITFVLLNYFVSQKDVAYDLLGIEQEKSESLLLNILPKEIADELKNEVRTIAEHHDSASVLFADLVGFTPMSSKITPNELVEILDEVFSALDVLVEKYQLEKISTIGDSYMVAAGVPQARPDHASAIILFGLEMVQYIEQYQTKSGDKLQFRVGVNSGPLVAGVVGQKKFHYDIWGDTVNTASRMESHGEPGKVQISKATYELVKDEFNCQPRGMIEVKGKGEMETWFVTRS